MTEENRILADKKLVNLMVGENSGRLFSHSYWTRIVFGSNGIKNEELHRHSYYELLIILKGSACYSILGEASKLKQGDYLFVPPRCDHGLLESSKNLQMLVWSFEINDDQKYLVEDFINVIHGRSEKCVSLAEDLIEEGLLYDQFSLEQVSSILDWILRVIIRENRALVNHNPKGVKNSVTEHAVKYIEDNIVSNPSVESIASELFISERQLLRIIKREMGCTVCELKARIRHKKTKELLLMGKLSNERVALLCGYPDVSYMSKTFKKQEGLTIAEYRKKKTKNK